MMRVVMLVWSIALIRKEFLYSLQFGRGFGEELVVKLVFVLTHMNHKRTAAAHLKQQQQQSSDEAYKRTQPPARASV